MQRRILAGFLGITVFVLIVLEVPLGLSYASRQHDELASDVERDAFFLAASAQELIEHSEVEALAAAAHAYAEDTGGRVVILDGSGDALVDTDPPSPGSRTFATRPEIVEALEGRVSTQLRRSETLGGGEYVYVAVPVASGGQVLGVVRVSYPTTEADEATTRYWFSLGAVGLVSLAFATAVGVAIARSVSRPLSRVEAAAVALGDGDLSARAPVTDGPVEVRNLGRSFNSTAARLEELIGAQDAFVADASHQLRTPLTALRLRLENLAAELGPVEHEDLHAAEAEVARMSRMVDGLLALARADRTGVTASEPADLAALVGERASAWEPVATERAVDIVVRREGPCLALVDPDRVDQVLDNLIANALEVSPPDSRVTVGCDRVTAGVELRVADEGPGMTAEDRARAFDRFWRGAEGRPRSDLGGSGLGLSIVRKLTEADGGTVRLDAASSGGVEAVVTYPPG